jgi:hypothetical protein
MNSFLGHICSYLAPKLKFWWIFSLAPKSTHSSLASDLAQPSIRRCSNHKLRLWSSPEIGPCNDLRARLTQWWCMFPLLPWPITRLQLSFPTSYSCHRDRTERRRDSMSTPRCTLRTWASIFLSQDVDIPFGEISNDKNLWGCFKWKHIEGSALPFTTNNKGNLTRPCTPGLLRQDPNPNVQTLQVIMPSEATAINTLAEEWNEHAKEWSISAAVFVHLRQAQLPLLGQPNYRKIIAQCLTYYWRFEWGHVGLVYYIFPQFEHRRKIERFDW